MAKIPFTLNAWRKDKSQRVETRDGRIVHNIWCVKEPFYTNNKKAEVCALIDGEEDALVFFEGGRYLPTTQDTDSPFDLFIITPEPELTEFEDALKDCVNMRNPENPMTDEGARNNATILRAIAFKEFKENEAPHMEELVKQKEKEAYERGKAEALKDLPMWRKWENGACGNGHGIPLAIVKRGLNDYKLVDALYISGEQYIMLSDLEKLPGFKED